MIDKYNVDANEIVAYTEIIPELVAFEKLRCHGKSKLEDVIPKFYAGGVDKKQRGFFLVIEDLSDEYKITDNAEGLNLQQIILAVENIAHFHALSYACGKENKIDWNQRCPIIMHHFMEDEQQLKALEANFPLFMEDLEQINAPRILIESAKRMGENYKEIFPKYLAVGDSKYLAHAALGKQHHVQI